MGSSRVHPDVFRKRYIITPSRSISFSVGGMGRRVVKEKVVSVKLSQQLLDALDEYCEKVGLTRSDAIRLAIVQLVWGMAGGCGGK